jgi:hypothetical protein
MSEKDNTDRVFEGLTAWMDSADTMTLAELRQVRSMMGDNVEESEREFLSWLENLKEGLGKHDWIRRQRPSGGTWEACKVCGVIRRNDDKNSPCKGPTRMRKMEIALAKSGQAG